MHGARVAVIYEPDGGRPLTVAHAGDRRLLTAVAQAAIAEADERAAALTEADAVLGAMHREEAARLRRVHSILVPEVREANCHWEVVGDSEGRDDDAGL